MNNFLFRLLPHIKVKKSIMYFYDGKLPDEPELPKGLTWEHATPELIDRVMIDDEQRRRHLKKFLERGAIGILIHNGEQWAAHGFISPKGVKLPYHLPDAISLQYWCFFYMHTRPEWRGKGLQKVCTKLILRYVYQLGGNYDEVLTDTGIKNIPSQKGFLRVGFKPAGVLRIINLKIPKKGYRNVWWNWYEAERTMMTE